MAMIARRSSSPATRLPQNSRRTTTLLLFLLLSALIVVFLSFSPHTRPQSSQFSIIIDAGSSGTRIHVFSFTINPSSSLPLIDLDRTVVMRSSPGLSSFVNNPNEAGNSIDELVKFAKRNVKAEMVGSTEIRLMATAGLRLVGEEVREEILESVRRVLRESGFKFQNDWASVIPGYEEGLYAWVAANYALNKLGGDPNETIGIIELGGASAQLTFVSDEKFPDESLHVLKFGNIKYNLCSKSFLHFGQNAAQESLHDLIKSGSMKLNGDPCMPKGYIYGNEMVKTDINGTGNFTECRKASFSLLKNGTGSTFIPALTGNFLATENFYFTSKFFGLDRKSRISDVSLAGEKFCSENWMNIKKKYNNINDTQLSRYCFSSAYIVALLNNRLNVPMNEYRIEFSNQIGDMQVEWALGAFITERIKSNNNIQNSNNFMNKFKYKNILAPLFLILALIAFVSVSVSKFRKPQTKTIYDLEKGRYIVTRVAS
ncbi:hypothetical protein LUZ60_006739 [Juncus effusus]|nr:hypothetical protein LUZ60_006739 [Juncus effusus]